VVVTVLGAGMGWLGHQVLVVRERTQVLDAIQGSVNGYGGVGRASMEYDNPANPPPTVSWIRRILGDRPANVIILPKNLAGDEEMIRRVRDAFPNARILSDDE